MRPSLLEDAKDACAKYDEEQSYRVLQERVKKKDSIRTFMYD
jgi:hypothetical protein